MLTSVQNCLINQIQTIQFKKMILVGSFIHFWDEEYIARTFEDLGWFVKRFEASETTVEDILEEHKIGNYDFLLSVNRELKEGHFDELFSKIKTVFWLFDIYIGTQRETLIKINPLFRCDYVFTTDGGHQKEFEAYEVNHQCLRQGIYEPEAYIGTFREEFHSKIAFVGTINPIDPNRRELIKFLIEAYGDDFKWWGRTGPNEIRGSQLNDLYASVNIIVGDTYPSPNYWSVRIYDTIGRGGFILFPETPGLEKEFEYYKHMIPYKHHDYVDLREKIDKYLGAPAIRNTIQSEGFIHCKEKHGFRGRCQKLLNIIQES